MFQMADGNPVYGQNSPFKASFSGWQQRILQVSAPLNITSLNVYALCREAKFGVAYFDEMALYRNC